MMDMGKALIFVGVLIVLLGVMILLAEKLPGVGKLPGDIFIKKENYTFYFPLTTSIILSIVLSVFFYFINKK